MSPPRLGVGIIGAGEVFQVCHGPCLLMLSHLFTLQSVCDLSPSTTSTVAAKFSFPHKTTTPAEVISHPSVDVVFILTSDESHATLAKAALSAGKHVFIEKPVSLSVASVQSIIDAEKAAPGGARVFVGYMRRYAPSYLDAFKREVATIPRILYARVRDFPGPNAHFVDQSGTFQAKNGDYPAGSGEERTAALEALYKEAFPGREVTDEMRNFNRFLGSLASHDISLMRETIGLPEGVSGVSANHPFYSAILDYKNKDGSSFSTTWESGIDDVPFFDAHIAVYGAKKRVTIKYDTPYVKGLPITVDVQEVNDHGEIQNRTILSSYEDAYTAELQVLHDALTNGTPIKTSAQDALQDLQIYDLIYKKWLGQ